MSRLSDAFAAARAQGRTALVCYAMGGDGDTAALLEGIDAAGADVIELGVPFSDPIADGPVMQTAATRAIAALPRVRGGLIVVNLSGRGDKDLGTVIETLK